MFLSIIPRGKEQSQENKSFKEAREQKTDS